MKKKTVVLIIFITTFFVGCANTSDLPTPISLSEDNELESSNINSVKDNYVESPQNDEVERFPDYFNNLIASYNDSAEKYDLNYKHPLSPTFLEEQDSDSYRYSYNFGIQSLTDPSSYETVEIKETIDENIVKSFKIVFPFDFDNETIRDFLLATIIMANPDIDYQDAISDMQSLINSFDGTSYSDIYKTKNYSILLNSENWMEPSTVLYVMHNSEINPDIDKNAYPIGTFETISSPLNAGLSVSINATICGDLNTDSYGHSTLEVVDESGNSFLLHFSYPNFCMDLDSSNECTFYGVITKSSALRLEHFSIFKNE